MQIDFASGHVRKIAVIDGQRMLPSGAARDEKFILLSAPPWIRWQGRPSDNCVGISLQSGSSADLCVDSRASHLRINEHFGLAPEPIFPLDDYLRTRSILDPQNPTVQEFAFDYQPQTQRLLFFDRKRVEFQSKSYYLVAITNLSSIKYIHADIPPPAGAGHANALAMARFTGGEIQYLVQSRYGNSNQSRYEVLAGADAELRTVAKFDCNLTDIDCSQPIAFLPDRGEVYFASPRTDTGSGQLSLLVVRYRTQKMVRVRLP